jgi:hypothetical protein
MRPRFQADADFNQKILLGLRAAAQAERILLTHDRNTMPGHLARFQADHSSPGVIVIAQNADIGVLIEDLLLVWATTDASEWRDQLGYLPLAG